MKFAQEHPVPGDPVAGFGVKPGGKPATTVATAPATPTPDSWAYRPPAPPQKPAEPEWVDHWPGELKKTAEDNAIRRAEQAETARAFKRIEQFSAQRRLRQTPQNAQKIVDYCTRKHGRLTVAGVDEACVQLQNELEWNLF
jgi:hypothetical protein